MIVNAKPFLKFCNHYVCTDVYFYPFIYSVHSAILSLHLIAFYILMVSHIHKVHLYLEYHSACPLVGIGTTRPPLPLASVYPPPEPGGTHSPGCEGRGSPNSDGLALCHLGRDSFILSICSLYSHLFSIHLSI